VLAAFFNDRAAEISMLWESPGVGLIGVVIDALEGLRL